MKRRLKTVVQNLVLAMVVLVVMVFISEGLLRIVFDPVDYLAPYLERDQILKNRVVPGSAGHDSWGYRNKAVPEKADIVAIGDSQTYGANAPSRFSWPALLREISGKSVYNLSLGGYGPLQYLHVLEDKALSLDPSVILVGFYYGNDLMDSYLMACSYDYWKDWRNQEDAAVCESDEKSDDETGYKYTAYKDMVLMGNLRDWLGHHSIMYRVLTDAAGDAFRRFDMKRVASKDIIVFEGAKKHLFTGFTPRKRLRAENLGKKEVEEGLRISIEAFSRMKDICAGKGVVFAVVLIPSKEMVYAEYIEGSKTLPQAGKIDELLENERRINERVKKAFDDYGIEYVDTLQPLQSALRERQVYSTTFDGHPQKGGYAVIAGAVNEYLSKK